MFCKNSVFWGNVDDSYLLDYIFYDSFETYLYNLLIKNNYKKILFCYESVFSFEQKSINLLFPKDRQKNLTQGPLGASNLYKKNQTFVEKDLMCFLQTIKNNKSIDESTTIIFKDIHNLLAKYNTTYLNEEFKSLLENKNLTIFFIFSEKTKDSLATIISEHKLDFLNQLDEQNYVEIKHPNKNEILDFFNYKRVFENIPINMELVENKIDIYLTQKKQLSDMISEIEHKYFLVSK